MGIESIQSNQNTFKVTGLIPLNAAEVLNRLNIQLRPLTPLLTDH